jgi:hypothetical protein
MPARGAADARRVRVEATPDEILLGGDRSEDVGLVIRVVDSGGEPVPGAHLVVHTTAGRIEGLTERSAGSFTAVLRRPTETFPQLAVITAADVSPTVRARRPWVGSAVVAYSAKIDLRGHTEPRAAMKVIISQRTFGPVEAARDGTFVLPVIVPPGEGWAKGISTDRLGNASRSKINLYLPEVRRVHGFIFPDAVVADGEDRAWVYVTTVSASGAPEEATITVTAEHGRISEPTRIDKGMFRLTYTAPVGVQERRDLLGVRRKRRREVTEIPVVLLPGPPAAVDVSQTPALTPADGETPSVIGIRVRDAHGSPADGHAVSVAVDNAEVPAPEKEPGVYEAVLPAREQLGSLPADVKVEPRTEICRRGRIVNVGKGRVVVDARGIGCTGRFILRSAEGGQLAGGQLASGGRLPLPEATAGALDHGAYLELENARPSRIGIGGVPGAGDVAGPLEAKAEARWTLPLAVDLRIREVGRKGDTLSLEVEASGVGDAGNRVRLAASNGTVAVRSSDGERLTAEVRDVAYPVDVLATDEQTGVSAWLRVE